MGEIIIVERILGLRLIHFHALEAGMHVHDEIVGVIFAAGPLGEAERSLLGDGARRCALEHGLPVRGGQFARVIAGKVGLILRIGPPRTDDRCPNRHGALPGWFCPRVFSCGS
jgi:hypothetical protein